MNNTPESVLALKKKEDAINIEFVSLFGTELGQQVLKRLRKATIEMVGGPEITNDQLRHLEGQRFLVALIEQRVALGHKAKQRESANVVLG